MVQKRFREEFKTCSKFAKLSSSKMSINWPEESYEKNVPESPGFNCSYCCRMTARFIVQTLNVAFRDKWQSRFATAMIQLLAAKEMSNHITVDGS